MRALASTGASCSCWRRRRALWRLHRRCARSRSPEAAPHRPQTQIAFRGVPAAQLGAITVSGSVSGVHAGRMAADSDRLGGSFLPASPFRPGEIVDGHDLAERRARPGRIVQLHDRLAGRPDPISHGLVSPRVRGAMSSGFTRGRPRARRGQDHTAHRLARARATSSSPRSSVPLQNGPMILDATGALVWFKSETARDVRHRLRRPAIRGQPVLTWWQGNQNAGTGRGVGLIYNTAYQQIAVVRAANGLSDDLHDFDITAQNTALITAYYPVFWDTSSLSAVPSTRSSSTASSRRSTSRPGSSCSSGTVSITSRSRRASTPTRAMAGPRSTTSTSTRSHQDCDGTRSSRRATRHHLQDRHDTGACSGALEASTRASSSGRGMTTVRQHSARVLRRRADHDVRQRRRPAACPQRSRGA